MHYDFELTTAKYRKPLIILGVVVAILALFFIAFIYFVYARKDDLGWRENIIFESMGSLYIPAICLVVFIYELGKELSNRRLFINCAIILVFFSVFIAISLPLYKDFWNVAIKGHKTYIVGKVTDIEWHWGKWRTNYPLNATVSIEGHPNRYYSTVRFEDADSRKLLQVGSTYKFMVAPESENIIEVKKTY